MGMIRKAILPDSMLDAVLGKGEGAHDMGSHTIIIKGNTVVTVY